MQQILSYITRCEKKVSSLNLFAIALFKCLIMTDFFSSYNVAKMRDMLIHFLLSFSIFLNQFKNHLKKLTQCFKGLLNHSKKCQYCIIFFIKLLLWLKKAGIKVVQKISGCTCIWPACKSKFIFMAAICISADFIAPAIYLSADTTCSHANGR